MSDMAYNSLKKLILQNKLVPGDLLSENLIAKNLGMSRTPVREALRMLSQEGVIEIIQGVGARVKEISSKDIDDLFEIRKSMEILAIRTAVFNFSEEEIRKFKDDFNSLKQMENLKEKDLIEEFTIIDRKFHNTIIEKSNNKYVKKIMKAINFNIQRYIGMSVLALGNVEKSIEQHMELLDLISKKDVEKLVPSLESHIDWSRSWITKER